MQVKKHTQYILESKLIEENLRVNILPYFSSKWNKAGKKRNYLQEQLLEFAGFSSMGEFIDYVSPQTCAIFFHAGLGSRWNQSLRDINNLNLDKKYKIDHHKPRGLVRIENFIPGINSEYIALASYNIFSISRAANKLIVIHGHGQKNDFAREIIEPFRISDKTFYMEQKMDSKTHKPLGHGDALIQLVNDPQNSSVLNVFKRSKFTITCFEGVPSRKSTVELTLLAMYVLDKYQKNISWLSPTTILDTPRYPFIIDKKGDITGLDHARLYGNELSKDRLEIRPNNIGIHIFNTSDIFPLLSNIKDQLKLKSDYTKIFPRLKINEFALDHLMEMIIKKKRLKIFNIADKIELENEVKTVDSLMRYSQDMQKMFIQDFEPKKISATETEKHMEYINYLLGKNPHNIVLLDPDPIKKGVGAGHSRQIYMVKLFLEGCKVGNNITHITLSQMNSNGLLLFLIFKLYKYFQSHPMIMDYINIIMSRLNDVTLIDRELLKSDYSKEITQLLRESKNFDPNKPTIFISTHVIETISAINIMNNSGLNGAVLEYIPDPFPVPVQLWMMSSPITCTNHYRIVHDEATASNLKKIRPEIAINSEVIPLGTLSNYKFLLIRKKKICDAGTYHIGIEFGGNYIPAYDKKIFIFLKTIKGKIMNGSIKITLHIMYHQKTYDKLNKFLIAEDLQSKVGKNIRIIHSLGVKNPVFHAIETREKYLTGELDGNWSSPDVVITKGSEVTLEHRGDMIMAAIYGAGHERIDALTGVKERRAINCITTKASKLWNRIEEEFKRRETEDLPGPSPSLAIFGLLTYLDQDYFKRNIISKLPDNWQD